MTLLSHRPWLAVFAVSAFAVLISLGKWQLERREWKHDLIARVEAARAAEPIDLVGALTASDVEIDYAHVDLDGVIPGTAAVHLFAPQGQGDADYRVIAPVEYGDNLYMLVDLGTITEAEKTRLGDYGLPPGAAGRVHITGILRPAETPGWIDAPPDLKGNRWYVRDAQAMAAALGVNAPWPYILQSDGPTKGGVPRAVPFTPDFPDNHLSYALTWFALALILLVIWILMSRRRV